MEKILRSETLGIFLKEDKYFVSKSARYGGPLDMQNDVNLNDLKIPLGVGMTGLVGTLGHVLYSNDATKESMYCNVPAHEDGVGNILSFPFSFNEKVFGVGEVHHKAASDYTEADSLYAKIIGELFGPILTQGLLLRKVNDISKRKEIVAQQLGTKRQRDPSDEPEMIRLKDMHRSIALNEFELLNFLPSKVPQKDCIAYIVAALEKLDLIAKFDVHVEGLIRFLQHQNKRQRSFPFRNWFHSFSCFQFLFSLLLNTKLVEEKGIRDIEMLTMLMATLCNGCDYGGATHRFQLESGPVLASVYCSPGQRNEYHAVSQSLETLNNPDFNFLPSTSPESYKEFLQLFDAMILYTDLADFVSSMKHFEVGSRSTLEVASTIEEDRVRVIQLLMACSKISDHARIWEHALEVGDRLHKEFHRSKQPTCSTRIFQLPGIDMLPIRAKLQSHLITSICLPAFRILQKVIPETQEYVSNLESNLKKLESLAKQLKRQELIERGEEQDAGSFEAVDDTE